MAEKESIMKGQHVYTENGSQVQCKTQNSFNVEFTIIAALDICGNFL